MKHDWTCELRSTALAGLLVLHGALSSTGVAQTSPAPSSRKTAASDALVIPLEYTELSYSVFSWGLSVQAQSTPFANEPNLGVRQVQRGRFNLQGGSGQGLAFIWDSREAKLYLDLNGNGDLNDDTNGVFSSEAKSGNGRYQWFKDVRVTLETDKGPYPLVLDLNLNQYSSLYVSASLRSLYAGKVKLADQEWQIGVVEKPYSSPGSLRDASLLLRPWESHSRSFRVDDGRLEAFAMPSLLFFNGEDYRVQCAWEAGGESNRYRLEFTRVTQPLGELKINGEFVHRVLLRAGGRAVVLDDPREIVRVPTGDYASFQVHLRKSEHGASLKTDYLNRDVKRTITVQADKPGVLVAGGPLTNSVTLQRRSGHLVLEHHVRGAGGDAYQLDNGTDYEHPPTFTIHLGDKELATGKFEFG